MDIWTEKLEQRHIPTLRRWIRRSSGAMTPNDLPDAEEKLSQWFESCAAEPGRLDCLILVYETPVGLAGLRRNCCRTGTAELYLLLCEVGYNPLRTATYATMRMLDRAFLDEGLARITVRVDRRRTEYLAALERMGFSGEAEEDGRIRLAVEKDLFSSRKYLF